MTCSLGKMIPEKSARVMNMANRSAIVRWGPVSSDGSYRVVLILWQTLDSGPQLKKEISRKGQYGGCRPASTWISVERRLKWTLLLQLLYRCLHEDSNTCPYHYCHLIKMRHVKQYTAYCRWNHSHHFHGWNCHAYRQNGLYFYIVR